MLPAIIAKLGIPLLVNLIGTALGKINNPVAQSAAEALGNVEGALAGGSITPEQLAEANRHAEAVAEMKSKEYQSALEEINQSLRAEVSSTDPYVRRMRPTFGYLLAATWSLQMIAIAYVMVFETDKISILLDGMEDMTAIWAVALSVLGIYVYQRGEEKKAVTRTYTVTPKALLEKVATTSNVTSSVSAPAYND